MKLIDFEKSLTHVFTRVALGTWETFLFAFGGAFLIFAVSGLVNMFDGDGMGGRTYVQQLAIVLGSLPWSAMGFYACYQRTGLIDKWKKDNK